MSPAELLGKAWPAAFALFLALSALPTLVFGLLVGFGELQVLPGFCGWAICSAVALGFGALLGRDIVVMTRLVRALQTNPEDLPRDTILLVPGMRVVLFYTAVRD